MISSIKVLALLSIIGFQVPVFATKIVNLSDDSVFAAGLQFNAHPETAPGGQLSSGVYVAPHWTGAGWTEIPKGKSMDFQDVVAFRVVKRNGDDVTWADADAIKYWAPLTIKPFTFSVDKGDEHDPNKNALAKNQGLYLLPFLKLKRDGVYQITPTLAPGIPLPSNFPHEVWDGAFTFLVQKNHLWLERERKTSNSIGNYVEKAADNTTATLYDASRDLWLILGPTGARARVGSGPLQQYQTGHWRPMSNGQVNAVDSAPGPTTSPAQPPAVVPDPAPASVPGPGPDPAPASVPGPAPGEDPNKLFGSP